MKVLHVAPSFYPSTAYGGATHSTSQLCFALAGLGTHVRVLTTDADGQQTLKNVSLDQEIDSGNLRVRYCRRQFRESVSFGLLKALPEAIAWADVVHLMAVYSFPTLPTLAFAAHLKKPLVWSPRGALQRYSGTRRRLGKYLWHVACRQLAPQRFFFHVTSDEEGKQTQAQWKNAEVRTVVNGVDLPPKRPATPTHAELRILYIGRLDPQKGLENLLKACAGLRLNRPWRLTIAGAGEKTYEKRLRSVGKQLVSEGQIHFIGAVHGEAKEKVFEDADLLIAPSYMESFCVSIAEGLAHGIPVIASRGTPWSGVESHDCGLWVDNSPESLTAAIQQMSRRSLTEMGERGRVWMNETFAWKTRAEKMMDVYQEAFSA